MTMYCDILYASLVPGHGHHSGRVSVIFLFAVRPILDNIYKYIQITKVCLTLTVNLKCAILHTEKRFLQFVMHIMAYSAKVK